MPNADGSPLEWIAKIPLFGWMRPKPRDDHGHSDVPVEFCGLDMNAQPNKPREPPKQQRSSPPKLCTKEESVLQTAPVSTCESSAASWSEMAVGSSDSSEMVTFHRLSQGVDSGPRRSPPPLTLTVDPELAPAPTAPPVDIPWRLIDPDSATNPMQEALSHSLAQMELRMSGRHTTKHAPTTTSASAHHNHRRALSALPIGRADAANGGHGHGLGLGHARAALAEGRGTAGGAVGPTSFWKQTPPAAVTVASGSFDEDDMPSPRDGVAGGRRQRGGGFEGYFPEDSASAADRRDGGGAAAAVAAAASTASDSTSTSRSCLMQEEEEGVDGDVLVSFAADGHLADGEEEEEDEEDGADSDMIFDFDDL